MPTQTRAEIAAAERAYHAEPNNEETCRELIAAYQSAGRRDDALRVCLSLQERMDAAGILPSEETRLLMNRLTAAPAVPRSGWSRRRLVQCAAALGVLTVAGAGMWQWAQQPVPAVKNALPSRPAEEWNAEGNRLAAIAAAEYHAGKYSEAGSKAFRAAQCYQQSGNGKEEAGVTLIMGECRLAQGDFLDAYRMFDQGLQLHRQHSTAHSVAHALELSGGLAVKQGRFADAQHLLQEAETLFRSPDANGKPEWNGVVQVLCHQGQIAVETEQFAQAEQIYTQAIQLSRTQTTDKNMQTYIQMLQGTLSLTQGNSARARRLLTQAQSYWNNKPDASPRWKAVSANRLAAVALAEQNAAEAETLLAVSLPIYRQVGDKLGEADTRLLRGRLFLMQNKRDAAETELNAAQGFFDAQGLMPRAARCRRVLAQLQVTHDDSAQNGK